MPLLKYLVANSVQKENRLLRGKTIECISLIGLAVGKYCFKMNIQPHPFAVHAGCSRSDATTLKVQTEQGEELEDDDPQVEGNNHIVTF